VSVSELDAALPSRWTFDQFVRLISYVGRRYTSELTRNFEAEGRGRGEAASFGPRRRRAANGGKFSG
jgi:hypothetical protein